LSNIVRLDPPPVHGRPDRIARKRPKYKKKAIRTSVDRGGGVGHRKARNVRFWTSGLMEQLNHNHNHIVKQDRLVTKQNSNRFFVSIHNITGIHINTKKFITRTRVKYNVK